MVAGDRSWSYLFALQISTEIKLVQTIKIGDRRWSDVRFKAMIESEIRLVNGSKLTRWAMLSGNDNIWDQASSTWLV